MFNNSIKESYELRVCNTAHLLMTPVGKGDGLSISFGWKFVFPLAGGSGEESPLLGEVPYLFPPDFMLLSNQYLGSLLSFWFVGTFLSSCSYFPLKLSSPITQ